MNRISSARAASTSSGARTAPVVASRYRGPSWPPAPPGPYSSEYAQGLAPGHAMRASSYPSCGPST
eukprot:1339231-Alexandrium_andersonii.AAC.1